MKLDRWYKNIVSIFLVMALFYSVLALSGTTVVDNIRTFNVSHDSPVVELVSPDNLSTIRTTTNISFVFNVTAGRTIENCTLLINEDRNFSYTAPITLATNQTLNVTLNNGNYLWSVNCTDIGFEMNGSLLRNLTVEYTVPTASLEFTTNSINWGSGFINLSKEGNCSLDTFGTNAGSCALFSTVTQSLVLENNGTYNLSVSLATNASAFTFIGKAGANLTYNVSANEVGSCINPDGTSRDPQPKLLFDINSTSPGTEICPILQNITNANSLKIGVNLSLPRTAAVGEKSVKFLAVGTIV